MATAPRDWKARAPRSLASASATPAVTFASDDTLPRLPVPDLEATLAKLDKTLIPIAQNPQELDVVRAKIRKLGESQGLGKILHQRLVNHASDPARANWLEEFWDDAAYLTYRDSVVVNVSYFYGFEETGPLTGTPAHRAAALVRSALLFRKALKHGTVKPDAVKDSAHCMDSYRWMFDCSRVPGLDGKDFSLTFAKEHHNAGDEGHIVVIRKNRFWKLDVGDVRSGKLLGTAALERQIKHVYEQSASEFPAVGVLTASNRDVWAKDYALLSQHERNRAILEDIESSAFVLCLDSEKPETDVELSRAMWHGGVQGGELGNRWVDKPVQFIVWDNGKAGIMGEHSVMDGTPTARMCGDVLNALKSPSFDHGDATSSSPSPTPLDFTLDQSLHTAITQAQSAAHALVSSQSLTYLRTSYGKSMIKKAGFGPDSWTQMIIQLAFHRLMRKGLVQGGGKRATYEAATTRKFQRGRTEAIRVVSEESVRWCEAMDEGSGVGSEDVRKLFKEACDVHGKYAREAGSGMGVDRHLFGLRKMLQSGETMPELFSDPLFQRSSYWVLSTSAIYNPNFRVYGWGEVVPDGFGVAYVAGFDDFLQFTVTSRKEMPNAEFSQELNKAAEDLRELFLAPTLSKL